MRAAALLLFWIFTRFAVAGTVTIQWDDDIVVDCEMTHWVDRGVDRYFCYGDDEWSAVTYFSSNQKRERYYYKIPIPLILTEAPADSVFFKVYKNDIIYFGGESVTLSICRMVEDLSPDFESLVGNYKAPLFDSTSIATSITFPEEYEGWISFNITELVNNWAFSKWKNYGLVLKMAQEHSPTQVRIGVYQSSVSNIDLHPKIEAYAPFLPDTIIRSSVPVLTDSYSNEENVTNFILAQNYPNPFNPSTTINYSIPNRLFVNISVYNSLGQKVAELVNEEKDAGSYQTSFEALDLSSGIYFYQIISGSFSETKKMMLIR